MPLTRRSALMGALSLPLAACDGGLSAPTDVAPTSSARAPRIEVAQNPAFDAWVAGFKPRAVAQGVSQNTVERAFRGVGYLPGVVERDRNQIQNRRSVEDYLAIATSDERVAMGRAKLRQYRATLDAIAGRYGVPAEVVTAVWGLESRYGTRRGNFPVIASLATLAFDGRRGAFFERQLVAALRILERGDTTPANMKGSWAGAMGHTQFIPTTYAAYAVDFTGDGRRDIWAEDPTDALASAAAYLSRSGWARGGRWGREVRVPEGLSAPTSSRGAPRRSLSGWAAAGVRAVTGPLSGGGSAALIRPGGRVGPYLLIEDNFRALLRYNNTDRYAIAVGHLSDRLRGAGPFQASFGPDATGLTLAQRRQLQARLSAQGYDIGTVDGVIGAKTEAAIRAFQRREGLAVTGQASPALLRRLGYHAAIGRG
jgi:lytic murein transglycosylase